MFCRIPDQVTSLGVSLPSGSPHGRPRPAPSFLPSPFLSSAPSSHRCIFASTPRGRTVRNTFNVSPFSVDIPKPKMLATPFYIIPIPLSIRGPHPQCPVGRPGVHVSSPITGCRTVTRGTQRTSLHPHYTSQQRSPRPPPPILWSVLGPQIKGPHTCQRPPTGFPPLACFNVCFQRYFPATSALMVLSHPFSLRPSGPRSGPHTSIRISPLRVFGQVARRAHVKPLSGGPTRTPATRRRFPPPPSIHRLGPHSNPPPPVCADPPPQQGGAGNRSPMGVCSPIVIPKLDFPLIKDRLSRLLCPRPSARFETGDALCLNRRLTPQGAIHMASPPSTLSLSLLFVRRTDLS